MQLTRATRFLTAVAAMLAIAACDDDPNAPTGTFTVACPTGVQGVNSPISLTFNRRIAATSAAGGNVVVTNAGTGLEIPGSLTLGGSGDVITFTPSSPLPYSDTIRVRVQNVLADSIGMQVPVTTCLLFTELPPITQLWWQGLPPATGTRLVGGSLVGRDSGYVASLAGPIFKRTTGEFAVTFNEAFYAGSNDVAFVTPRIGFISVFNNREFAAVIQRTLDGGITWDSVASTLFETVNRLWMVPTAAAPTATTGFYGLAGGGTSASARIQRYVPGTNSVTTALNALNTANITDIDIASSGAGRNRFGAASSFGIRFPLAFNPGKLFVTADSGASWTEVPAAQADSQTVLWSGVAIKSNCEVWLAGGNGALVRIAPTAGCGSAYGTPTRIALGLQSPDSTDPNALLVSDVQFAPGSDQLGWAIGAQQVGVVGGEPRYQGFIFETTNGGTSWTRQGVLDAGNFGAEFARLNRIVVQPGTSATTPTVWLVGDAGTVLTYRPQ